MIVWSRGLGKQRLPLELADAKLRIEPDWLVMEGEIEPVCWNYAIRLGTTDLQAFLRHLAKPETAKFLSERGGLLWPLIAGMIAAAPRLIATFLSARLAAALHGKHRNREDDHAFLV